jgi:hypothetical protein
MDFIQKHRRIAIILVAISFLAIILSSLLPAFLY